MAMVPETILDPHRDGGSVLRACKLLRDDGHGRLIMLNVSEFREGTPLCVNVWLVGAKNSNPASEVNSACF